MALASKQKASTRPAPVVSLFKDGATTDEQVMLTYMAELPSEQQDAILQSGKTQAEVAAIVRGIPGAGPAVDEQRVSALADFADSLGDEEEDTGEGEEEAGPTATAETVAADYRLQSAKDFAAKFDAELSAAVEEEVVASERKKRGALPILYHFFRTHGEDGMAVLPEPGSPELMVAADGKTEIKRNIFDTYKRQVSRDGNKRMVTKSFYGDAFDLSPFGQTIQEELRGLAEAMRTPPLKSAPVKYKKMSKAERIAARNRLNARRSDGVNLFKRAGRVWLQIQAFKTLEPTIKWSWVAGEARGKDQAKPGLDSAEAFNAITHSTTPFYIYEPGDTTGQNNEVATITTFLSYDCALAKANGGTMQDLWATAGRDEGDDDKAKEVFIPQANASLKDAEQMVTGLVNFWDQAKNVSDTYTLFRKGTEERKHMVLSFGELFGHVRNIFAKIERDYDQFKQEELTADEAGNSARAEQQRKAANK